MIQLRFTRSSDARVVAALRTKAPRLRAALRETLDGLMLELLKRIQQKLSGEVLTSHHGGRGLLGSAKKSPTVVDGNTIRGSVTAGGGRFFYGRFQEEGTKGPYEILPGALTGKSDKQALAFFPGGSAGATTLRLQGLRLSFKLGKRRGTLRPQGLGEFAGLGGIVVRKVVHPGLKARSFMASSLDELRGEITRRIFATAARAIS